MPAATDQPIRQDTEAIKRLLKRSGLSQHEFARKAGISQGALSLIINGHSNAMLGTIHLLASAFDVPVSALLSAPVDGEAA